MCFRADLSFSRLTVAKIEQLHDLNCLWHRSDVVHIFVFTGKQLLFCIGVLKFVRVLLTNGRGK